MNDPFPSRSDFTLDAMHAAIYAARNLSVSRIQASNPGAPMRLSHNRLHLVVLLTLVTSLQARSEPPAKENQPARLDRYGDPLPEGAIARLGTTRWRPGEFAMALAYSPDGSCVASAGHDPTIRLWEAATGKLIATLWGHQSYVFTLAFSPDGKKLVSGAEDKTVRLWEVATGKELQRFSGHYNPVRNVSFGSDGRSLVSVDDDNSVRRWDPRTGKQIGEFRSPGPAFALSSNGRWLAAGDFGDGFRSKGLVVLDVDTGRKIHSFDENVDSVSFSPNGRILAIGTRGRKRLWNWHTGDLLVSFDVRGFGGYGSAFSTDNKMVAQEEEDNAIVIRDVATGKRLHVLRGHQHNIRALAFAPDGSTLLSATAEMTIRRWKLRTGEAVPSGDGHDGYAVSLAFSPDGKMLASGAFDRVIRLWDCTTTKQLHAWEGREGVVNIAVAFSSDGKMVAAGGGGGTIWVWDVASKQLIHRFQVPEIKPGLNVIDALVFSADNRVLFAGGFSDNIERWDLASAKGLPPFLGHKKAVTNLARSPDGKTLVSSSHDGTVRIWDAAGKELRRLKCGSDGVRDAAISPNGTMIASDGGNGTIQLWNTATGKQIRQWKTCHSVVLSLAFSADGKYLASAGLSRVIGLWEVATGRAQPPALGHRGGVWRVAFSPDGKTLASTGNDTTILLWDTDQLFRKKSTQGHPLTEQELEVYWSDLSDPDPYPVSQAVEMLFAAGLQSVNLIRQRLPQHLAQAGRVERLITDLNSDDFATREKASAELEKLGSIPESALRRTSKKPASPEVEQRVAALLDKLPKKETAFAMSEMQRPLQALSVLEWIDSSESRELLSELSRGDPEARLTREAKACLERLAKRSVAKP